MYNTNKKSHYMLIILLIFILNSCVSSEINDLSNETSAGDPFESTNRGIFLINEKLDDYLFKPVARGWREIPKFPRENLSNLAETAGAPLDIANAILQLDTESIRLTLSRFIINVTFGIGGMYDVASTEAFGKIEKRNEDFGQTLAVWGFSEGPYIMLPIFGPSNIRDTIGRGVDTLFNPVTFAYRMNGIGFESRLPQPVVSGASTREKYMDYIDEIKSSSLDFYATMRSLYGQQREKEILNGKKKKIKNINYDIPQYDFSPKEQINQEMQKIIEPNIIKDKDSLPSSSYPEYNETDLLTN